MPYEVPADLEALQYASAADAVAAATSRGGGDAFVALSTPEQDRLLVAASLDLDTSDWIGTRASTTEQELEWPRVGTDYSADAWPQKLVDATIQLAFANAQKKADDASADLLNPTLNNIKREKTGPLETEYFAPVTTAATDVSRWPTIVQALIAPLIRSAIMGYGSGVAYRGS